MADTNIDELGIPGDVICNAIDLGNLGVIAPHKNKYIYRYDIDWLISEYEHDKSIKCVAFWQAGPGHKNACFSQWYKNEHFYVNGRKYVTAEQYMMSEKALLFGDLDSYRAIMKEGDPSECKKLGRGVKNFDSAVWKKAMREIIFHGNLAKLQSDICIVDALLETGDAVLVEASPVDDIYGSGVSADDLLNGDGTLKISPQEWHKEGSSKLAENNLGFVLMGLRDLFMDLMPGGWDD